MKTMTVITLAVALALSSWTAHAAEATSGNADHVVEGEVRKVDKSARKITIKHGELKLYDMPPMTMVFQVKDAALLDKVKAGDKVNFVVEKIGGQFAVADIEKTGR